MVIGPEDRIMLEGTLNDSFTSVGKHRNASFCREFTLLLHRNVLFQYRNPHQAIALALSAVFLAIMEACVFHGVGAEKYTYNYEHDISITQNFVGLSFIVTTEVYCFSSLH